MSQNGTESETQPGGRKNTTQGGPAGWKWQQGHLSITPHLVAAGSPRGKLPGLPHLFLRQAVGFEQTHPILHVGESPTRLWFWRCVCWDGLKAEVAYRAPPKGQEEDRYWLLDGLSLSGPPQHSSGLPDSKADVEWLFPIMLLHPWLPKVRGTHLHACVW